MSALGASLTTVGSVAIGLNKVCNRDSRKEEPLPATTGPTPHADEPAAQVKEHSASAFVHVPTQDEDLDATDQLVLESTTGTQQSPRRELHAAVGAPGPGAAV